MTLTMKAGREGKDRHLFIGGSEAAAILNLPPYGCARFAFLRKLDIDAVPPFDGNAFTERGHALEENGARVWRKSTGIFARKYREGDELDSGNQLAAKHPWLHVHPDRVMLEPTPEEWQALAGDLPRPSGPGYLEIKTAHSRLLPQMDAGLPLHFLAQVRHGMLRLGYTWGAVQVTFADEWQHRRWVVAEDPEQQAAYLEAGDAFWQRVQVARGAWGWKPGAPLHVPQERWDEHAPDRLDPKDKRCRNCPVRQECQGQRLLELLHEPAIGGESVARMDDDPRWNIAMANHRTATELEEEAKQLKDAARAELEALMGDRGAARSKAGSVIWRPQVRKVLDGARLKRENVHIFEAYQKDQATRPFRVFHY